MISRFGAVLAFSFAVCAFSPCEARRMEKVILECDSLPRFNDYADCIRQTYSKRGNAKSDGIVLTFYALVEEIREVYNSTQSGLEPMSEAQARSNVMRAWQATINADNVGERSHSCSMNGKSLVCS